MKIVLVRHGDAVNGQGKFHGLVDNPLTDSGRKEAEDIVPSIARHNPTEIYSSPLSRTRETANIIGQKLGLPVKTAGALKPLDLGNFVGKSTDAHSEQVKHYLENPNEKIPGGGTVNQWANNYLPFFNGVFNHKSQGTAVFVTHGRNILLSKAHIKAGAKGTNFDKNTLLNSDKSTEHGGYAVAEPPNKFSIETPRSVKPGTS